MTGVDISAFISHLPGSIDTTNFSTSTAVPHVAGRLDHRVPAAGAPVLPSTRTPQRAKISSWDTACVTMVAADKSRSPRSWTEGVLLTGGPLRSSWWSAAQVFLDASRVTLMDNYRCLDVTERAKQVAADLPRPPMPPPPGTARHGSLSPRREVDRPRTKGNRDARPDRGSAGRRYL